MKTENPSPASPLRRVVALSAGALTLVAALVFAPQLLRGTAESATSEETSSGAAVSVRVVVVKEHERDNETKKLRATGTLESRREVALAFAVSGVVLATPGDEGERAKEGTPLARLDPVPFESAVAQAEASVRYLEKSVARSRNLRDQKALSAEEFDAQSAELDAARAQLELAEWKLQRSVLRAPFPGHVARRHVEAGQVVSPASIAFEFLDLDHLEFRAAIAAADLGRLAWKGSVEVVASDDPTLRASARIDHAPIQSDARSGSIPVLVRLDNPRSSDDGSARWLPGMVVEAMFETRDGSAFGQELRVPLSCLRIDDSGPAVWRLHEGRAERVDVELGPVRGDQVVVLEGLDAGETIIDEAPDRLRAGDAVAVAEVLR